MSRFTHRLSSWFVALLIACLGYTPVWAGLAPSRTSGDVAVVTSERQADLLVVQRVLENKVVAQKLCDYGVTAEQAQARLARLDDTELHSLASASRGLPSGGDATGAVIGILVVAILVVILLKLLGHDVIVR
jgi:hypothetical protein